MIPISTRNLILYVIATLLLLVDYAIFLGDFMYALLYFLSILVPVVGVSALVMLLCVLLWKKHVQISKEEMFYFVAYYTAIPYCVFSGSVLVILLFTLLFTLIF